MAIVNTSHSSKLVVGLDVAPGVISSAGSATINGPMYIGAPTPGPALVNITLPTGIPSLQNLLSSGIALSVIAPAIGINVTAPINNIIGTLNVEGVVNVAGILNVAAIANVGGLVNAGLSVNIFKTIRVAKMGTIGGPLFVGGPIISKWLSAKLASKKSFDIPHPTKDNHRLRHVCLEGSSADVYYRGKLNNKNEIILPEYWSKLVDPESITVNLTPIGSYQELYVEDISWGRKITVKNNLGGSVKCHFTVYGERNDVEKNICEYEGTTPNDYPGDNSDYRVG